MEKNYKIIYRVENSQFELESSDLEWIKQKEKEYLNRITDLPKESKAQKDVEKPKGGNRETETVNVPGNMTATEFYQLYIKKKGIKTRPQIALFFVYFLEKVQKRNDIKTGDIINCFKDIGWPNYSKINMADILNQNRRKGYLNYVNNNWTLTITAVDYILNKITTVENE